MTYAALIVIHQSAGHLEALLHSLARHPHPPAQLVVVDSGSSDAGAEIAAAHGAQVIALDANRGFGAANNVGLHAVNHEVTVLLNPDCEVLDDSLSRLAALAGAHNALFVPRLLSPDASPQRSVHPLPGRADALVPALWPPRALPRALREHFEPWRAQRPRCVGWAIAACLAARTSLLRRLGPFDPDTFLFYEDLELCLRARAAGVGVELRPELRVVHHGAHATGPAFGGEAFASQARRRRAVIAGHLGPRALAVDDLAQALTFATRAAVGRERARNTAHLRALLSARRT